jgi:hypothetical protein
MPPSTAADERDEEFPCCTKQDLKKNDLPGSEEKSHWGITHQNPDRESWPTNHAIGTSHTPFPPTERRERKDPQPDVDGDLERTERDFDHLRFLQIQKHRKKKARRERERERERERVFWRRAFWVAARIPWRQRRRRLLHCCCNLLHGQRLVSAPHIMGSCPSSTLLHKKQQQLSFHPCTHHP